MLPLPKVAYATSRVATALGQNPTIRNALHLQSSPTPSSKSNTPGSNYFQQNKGSSKPLYNFFDQASGGSRGSRFTHGYLGASRVVTQVQPVVANDTGYMQNDEYEEVITLSPVTSFHRRRYRSHSLSYSSPERAKNLGVLSTVQKHARSRHAFARALTTDDLAPEALESTPSSPITRRNSTASITRSDISLEDITPPPPSPFDSLPLSSGHINVKSQRDMPTQQPPSVSEEESEHYRAFMHARSSGDHEIALLSVNNFRRALDTNLVTPSIFDFNAALEALYYTRPAGSPLSDMQSLYNQMIQLNVRPNRRTYHVLILAHCDRDNEVVWALNGLEQKLKAQKLCDSSTVPVLSTADQARKDALQQENNFSSAVALFRILRIVPNIEQTRLSVFSRLLGCCAHYGDVDSAIMIWETLEQRAAKPIATLYKYMIQTFGRVGEIDAAGDIFADFREQSASGQIAWGPEGDLENANRSAIQVWNVMIEAYFKCGKPDMAVGLLQEMLEPRTGEGEVLHLPFPAPSTYTTIIAGFCNSGDYQSAMSWFNTLISQNTPPRHSFDPSPSPTRPDSIVYRVLIESLSQQTDMLASLNTVWSHLLQHAEQDDILIRRIDRFLVANANMATIQSIRTSVGDEPLSEESLKKCIDLLEVAKSTVDLTSSTSSYVPRIWETYFDLGLPTQGTDFALWLFENQKGVSAPFLRSQISKFVPLCLAHDWQRTTSVHIALEYTFKLHELAVQANQLLGWRSHLMQQYSYFRAQSMSVTDLQPVQVKLLCVAAAGLEMAEPHHRPQFVGLVPFLEDLVQQNGHVVLPFFGFKARSTLFKALLYDRSVYQVKSLLEELGLSESFKENLDEIQPAASSASESPTISTIDSASITEPDTPLTESASVDNPAHRSLYQDIDPQNTPSHLSIDRSVTRSMEGFLLAASRSTGSNLEQAWRLFEQGLKAGKVPTPYSLSRMCQAYGRAKDLDKVKMIYAASQSLLARMEHDKQMQSDAWFLIEDGMIIAMAQAGEIDAAHVHRQRILEQGGAPSADAYGGLILNVKDTTDDTSNAMALFNESQMLNVVPNHYLYNNIISKLAKARKADAALDLFSRMKASGISPSSITYGAVIGACARVGDATSAEVLYAEMIQAPSFKPRIPPFNTMMQLYTTTKPNRDRALFFYDEILRYKVAPTAYTYKLLMEAYVLEPLDIPKMEEVFQQLVNNRRLELQGTHFATLINAYGCVAKDLEKALSVYNSIFDHPRRPVVDAIVFEAMANTFVVHRRIDLMAQLISKMNDLGIHMTAYIVNVMIRGHAAVGDIERSRELFESLVDPPQGVAALHNHAPHEPSLMTSVNPMEPVYREPSTWEAMVRAELGSGDRERALALIERMEARKYPEAVVNRIRGILVDHSQLSMLA